MGQQERVPGSGLVGESELRLCAPARGPAPALAARTRGARRARVGSPTKRSGAATALRAHSRLPAAVPGAERATSGALRLRCWVCCASVARSMAGIPELRAEWGRRWARSVKPSQAPAAGRDVSAAVYLVALRKVAEGSDGTRQTAPPRQHGLTRPMGPFLLRTTPTESFLRAVALTTRSTCARRCTSSRTILICLFPTRGTSTFTPRAAGLRICPALRTISTSSSAISKSQKY